MKSGMTALRNDSPLPRTTPPLPGLDDAIAHSVELLLSLQHEDGHWVFELEADATIPSEYILLQHFLGRVEPESDERIARHLRAEQGEDGGWPLYYGGAMD